MAEDKYRDWPDKAQTASTLGLSIRQLERRIERGEIRVKHRPLPGRKPVTVCRPEDIERLKQEVLKPVPAPPPGGTLSSPRLPALRPGTLPAKASPTDLLAMLMATTETVSIERRVYLTLKQASAYAGLPAAYLKRLIEQKKLKAIKAGGWRIRRADLEKL